MNSLAYTSHGHSSSMQSYWGNSPHIVATKRTLKITDVENFPKKATKFANLSCAKRNAIEEMCLPNC
jgi:hypothetical protein